MNPPNTPDSGNKSFTDPENLNLEEITEERRKALAESIHSISVTELREIGEKLFPFVDHPWRATFFDFIEENSRASFYHATTKDGIHIVYCQDRDKGLWFLQKGGMGPLRPVGLKIMKQLCVGA